MLKGVENGSSNRLVLFSVRRAQTVGYVLHFMLQMMQFRAEVRSVAGRVCRSWTTPFIAG